jgi:hypothetical protein
MKVPLIIVVLLALGASGAADSSGLSSAKVRLELYDISDWTYSVNDFGGGIRDVIDEPVPEGRISPDEFAAKVMKTIVSGNWGDKRGWSIQSQNGLLIVRAPSFVHRQLSTYLKELKSTSSH